MALTLGYDSAGTYGPAAQEEMVWFKVWWCIMLPLASICLMFVVVVVLNITVGAMWVHEKAVGVQKQVPPPE